MRELKVYGMSKNKGAVEVSEVAIWMATILSVILFVMAMAMAAAGVITSDPSFYWLTGLSVAGITASWWGALSGEWNPRPRHRRGGGYHYGYDYDPGAIHD